MAARNTIFRFAAHPEILRLATAFAKDRGGDQAHRECNKRRKDDQVVQITQNRDEIRYQIDWRQRIGNGEPRCDFSRNGVSFCTCQVVKNITREPNALVILSVQQLIYHQFIDMGILGQGSRLSARARRPHRYRSFHWGKEDAYSLYAIS